LQVRHPAPPSALTHSRSAGRKAGTVESKNAALKSTRSENVDLNSTRQNFKGNERPFKLERFAPLTSTTNDERVMVLNLHMADS
jgi:hypothetical protein